MQPPLSSSATRTGPCATTITVNRIVAVAASRSTSRQRNPNASLSGEFWLPVILSERVDELGRRGQVDVREEWDYLFWLMQARTRVDFTFGARTMRAHLDKVAVDRGGGFGWYERDRSCSWPP